MPRIRSHAESGPHTELVPRNAVLKPAPIRDSPRRAAPTDHERSDAPECLSGPEARAESIGAAGGLCLRRPLSPMSGPRARAESRRPSSRIGTAGSCALHRPLSPASDHHSRSAHGGPPAMAPRTTGPGAARLEPRRPAVGSVGPRLRRPCARDCAPATVPPRDAPPGFRVPHRHARDRPWCPILLGLTGDGTGRGDAGTVRPRWRRRIGRW